MFHVYKTALYIAVEKNSIDFVKLFLENEKIDVNIPYILSFNFLNEIQNIKIQWNFKSIFFNLIQNYIYINKIIKSNISIQFKIIFPNKIMIFIYE